MGSEFEPTAGSVIGRYELLMPIGRGGMARVWAARLSSARGFQKTVALKMLLPDREDPEHEQMLFDEAMLVARIQHPNVASVLDFGEQDGAFYLVMEWVAGESLETILALSSRRGCLPLTVVVELAIETCRGLHAAHELCDDDGTLLSVVHRDVSPQNILVRYDGIAKLVDFGVAKSKRHSRETGFGEIKGKIAYMAPEQIRGESVDRQTDVFAMGIVLYLMITGTHPFRAATPPETLNNICFGDDPPPPSSYRSDCPPELDQIVAKALARERAQRFANAEELMDALERASRHAPNHEPRARDYLPELLRDAAKKKRSALANAIRISDLRGAARAAHVVDGDLETPPVDVQSDQTLLYSSSTEGSYPSFSSLRGLTVSPTESVRPRASSQTEATRPLKVARPAQGRSRVLVPLGLTGVVVLAMAGGFPTVDGQASAPVNTRALAAGEPAVRTAVALIANLCAQGLATNSTATQPAKKQSPPNGVTIPNLVTPVKANE